MRAKAFVGALVTGALALASSAAWAGDFTVTPKADFTAYVINGVDNPALTLTRGHTYTFDVSAPGHPFFIKTSPVTGAGSTFDSGVTNNGTTSLTVTFNVPASAPATLFYQCSVHSGMHGTLSIMDAPAVPAGGGVTRGLIGVLLAILGFVAVGRVRRTLTRSRLSA